VLPAVFLIFGIGILLVFIRFSWEEKLVAPLIAAPTLRPMLAAYQNFSRFSSLLLKIGLILCFGMVSLEPSSLPNEMFFSPFPRCIPISSCST
jgi:hypothetical protein